MCKEIAKRIIRSLQLTTSISADVETVALTHGVADRRLPQEIEARAVNLLSQFISDLETNLGPRRINFDAIAVRQSNDGPGFLVVGADATVFVGPNATKYEPTLVANLAHESVHLLDATSGGASRLEEGLAVDFELSVVGRRYGTKEIENFERCLPRSYTQALIDYRKLLRLDSSAAVRIRQEFGTLTGPTAAELRRLVPSLSCWLAYRLVRRIRMRPA